MQQRPQVVPVGGGSGPIILAGPQIVNYSQPMQVQRFQPQMNVQQVQPQMNIQQVQPQMNLQQVQMQPQGVVILPGPQVYQGQAFSQHQPASGVVVVATPQQQQFQYAQPTRVP